jgi:hypothetical protein
LICQNLLLFRVRAMIEGVAVFARCLVIFGITAYTSGAAGVHAWAAGQLAYSCVLAGGYLAFFGTRIARNQRKHLKQGWHFWKRLKRLGLTLIRSSTASSECQAADSVKTLDEQERLLICLISWKSLLPAKIFMNHDASSTRYACACHAGEATHGILLSLSRSLSVCR